MTGTKRGQGNLLQAPCECIDYVILHELCHIAEHNHSEWFYRLTGQVMPKWGKTKERLDGVATSIIM
ncbi:MAG: YgjP-like metallopeptidase domain-containing protein [Nitrincola lacisaponensis]|uniref:YgjP-like metallopeptidase domain-containing protein n=1 Tax=Nitrincola lacisaponensis TaxID=267850 RepID=UPI00391918C5